MTLGDLLDALRVRLDDTVEPYLYDTPSLTAYLNDAVRQAAIRKRLLLDRTTPECCRATVDAGQAEVRIHPDVLALRSVRWSGSTRPLKLTTLKVMDRDRPEWTTAPQDHPTHVIVDAQSGAIVLWPTPHVAGTLAMAVWRVPLETEQMESPDDEPVIEPVWHRDLLDWAEHLAFLTKDGETRDEARATAAAGRFEAKFGRLPSAHEIKCWGIAPPRGQRAEFL